MDIKTLFTEQELKDKADFLSEVGDFQSELNGCYQEIIEIRRSGRDLFVEEILYRTIKSKIEYLKASESKDVMNEMNKLLNELKAEINDAKSQEIINVKKEIEQRLKKDGIHFIGEVDDEDF